MGIGQISVDLFRHYYSMQNDGRLLFYDMLCAAQNIITMQVRVRVFIGHVGS